MGCLPKLAVGLGDFRLPKWGFRPKPQASKKRQFPVSFVLVFFRKWHKLKKAPPAISLRAFHAEALPCLSAGLPTQKEASLHFYNDSFQKLRSYFRDALRQKLNKDNLHLFHPIKFQVQRFLNFFLKPLIHE